MLINKAHVFAFMNKNCVIKTLRPIIRKAYGLLVKSHQVCSVMTLIHY